jgi:hypothetical protein
LTASTRLHIKHVIMIINYTEKSGILPMSVIIFFSASNSGRQINRAGHPADNPSQFWQRSMYYPFLDNYITELTARLLENGGRYQARYLIPMNVRFKATENREWSLRRSCAGRHGVKYQQNGADRRIELFVCDVRVSFRFDETISCTKKYYYWHGKNPTFSV